MFYSQHVLTKKGPLAKIWLAAHMQSKLTKAMVFGTDLQKAVDSIISPDAPMALRLTSNLLLGVVRILHRKTKYLLQESSDALTKLKLTFRPSSNNSVDLPATTPAANFAAVTLADATVDDLAAPMVDLSLIPARPNRPSATSAFLAADRDITIDEFAGGLAGGMLDAFAFEPELDRDAATAGLDLADLDADRNEPLLFTPSQRPSQRLGASPQTPSVTSNPLSVEVLRAAPVEEADNFAATPVLSVERDLPLSAEGLRKDAPDLPLPETPELRTPSAAAANLEESPAALSFSGGPDADVAMLGVSTGDAGERLEPGRISAGGDELALVDEEMPLIDGTQPTVAMETREPVEEGEQVVADIPLANVPRNQTQLTLTLGEATFDQPTHEEVGEEPTQAVSQVEALEEHAIEDAPSRGRKRRRVLIEDPTTELSTRAFRAFLSDTSDLLRPPNSRRRITPAWRQPQGRRAPLRYEELLARPTIPLAPQLNELFAVAFQIEEGVRQPGSPVSEVDVQGAKDRAKEAEPDGEAADVIDSPAKSLPEASPEKAAGDTHDLERSVTIQQSEEKEVGSKDGELRNAERSPPEKEVVADLFPVSPLPEGEDGFAYDVEGRRSSMGTDAAPVLDDPSVLGTRSAPVQGRPDAFGEKVFDSSLCYLKDVATTRSQIEHDQNAGESVDVTESTISARTRKMQEYITEHLDDGGELNYTEALLSEPGITRRVSSRTFYELLNLSSKKALKLSQDGYYGTIRARPIQPLFAELAAANNE